MKNYYQYGADNIILARVKSASAPLNGDQVVSDSPLPHGLKKFDPVTKEVIYLKRTRDQDGNITGSEEDTNIARIEISDANILKGV